MVHYYMCTQTVHDKRESVQLHCDDLGQTSASIVSSVEDVESNPMSITGRLFRHETSLSRVLLH